MDQVANCWCRRELTEELSKARAAAEEAEAARDTGIAAARDAEKRAHAAALKVCWVFLKSCGSCFDCSESDVGNACHSEQVSSSQPCDFALYHALE